MHITVRLLGSFRDLVPDAGVAPGCTSLVVPDGETVADVLARLPIPARGLPTFFVNGRHSEREQVLREGDELSVFPAVGGGQ